MRPLTPKSARLASLDVQVLLSRRQLSLNSTAAERWRMATDEANRRTEEACRLADELQRALRREKAASTVKTWAMRLLRKKDRKKEEAAYARMLSKIEKENQKFELAMQQANLDSSFKLDAAAKARRQSSCAKKKMLARQSTRTVIGSVQQMVMGDKVTGLLEEREKLLARIQLLEADNRRARLETKAAAEAAMEASAKASDIGVNGEEGLVRALAARHLEKGSVVEPKHIAQRLQRKLGIELHTEHLDTLQESILASRAVYGAARAQIHDLEGYDELLAIPERCDPGLCQESDDFATVFSQAKEAQKLMLRIVATEWRPDAHAPLLHVPALECAAPWVDAAVSPGIKSEARSLEKMDDDYGGHANKLKDISRVTLSYEEILRMVRAVKGEMGANGLRIVSLKNKFAYPTSMGYSDLNAVAVLLLEDGTKFLVEVQLNHPAMIRAKQEAHVHYEVIRSTIPKCVEGTAVSATDLEDFLVENAATAASGGASSGDLTGPLENNIMQHLEGSALEFATGQLMEKVDSLEDAMKLGAEMERLANETGQPLTLEAIAGLPDMPDREVRRRREAATKATALAALADLEDESRQVRNGAVSALRALEPEVFAKNATAVVERLAHARWETREAALRALDALVPAVLAKHANAVAARLEDERMEVRSTALQVLGKLERKPFAMHAPSVAARLEDESEDVRKAALQLLGSSLDGAALEQHAAALVAALADKAEQVVRGAKALLDTLRLGAHAALTKHAGRLFAKLDGSPDPDVRCAAMRALHAVESEVLASHVAVFVKRLEDEHPQTRKMALQHVARLAPKPQQHAAAFVAALDDGLTRRAALDALRTVEPTALADHIEALITKLTHPWKEVRAAAVQTMARLPPAELKSCAFTAIAALAHNEDGKESSASPLIELGPSTRAAKVPSSTFHLAVSVYMPAVQALGKLEPDDLATHAYAIVEKLADDRPGLEIIRKLVVQTLGVLTPEALEMHAARALRKWDKSEKEKSVHLAGVPTLIKLEPDSLTTRAAYVVSCLDDVDPVVQAAAVDVTAKLTAALGRDKARALVAAKLVHPSPEVRKAAVLTMAANWLKPDTRPALQRIWLGPGAETGFDDAMSSIVERLTDDDPIVRKAAATVLERLEPTAVASAMDLSAVLGHTDLVVRRLAVQMVGTLPPTELVAYAAALDARLEDADQDVQSAAARMLRALAKGHRKALEEVLEERAAPVIERVTGPVRLVIRQSDQCLCAVG